MLLELRMLFLFFLKDSMLCGLLSIGGFLCERLKKFFFYQQVDLCVNHPFAF